MMTATMPVSTNGHSHNGHSKGIEKNAMTEICRNARTTHYYVKKVANTASAVATANARLVTRQQKRTCIYMSFLFYMTITTRMNTSIHSIELHYPIS